MHTDEPLLRSYPSHVGVAAVGAEKTGQGKFESLLEEDDGSVSSSNDLSFPLLFPPHCMSRPAKEVFAFPGIQLKWFLLNPLEDVLVEKFLVQFRHLSSSKQSEIAGIATHLWIRSAKRR